MQLNITYLCFTNNFDAKNTETQDSSLPNRTIIILASKQGGFHKNWEGWQLSA